MKRLAIIMSALFLTAGVFAQADMESKRGVPILPEQGDIGLGIDANPILNHIGNMFNGNVNNNNAAFNFMGGMQAGNTVYLKYYLEDKVAVRAGVRFGHTNGIDREFVMKDDDVPNPLIQVTDTRTFTTNFINVGGDYLMYRGKGRVQGYYGGGLMFMYWATNEKYDYGNPITSTFTSPETHNFGANIPNGSGERMLERYTKNRLGVGARAVIGVEYFFAPKISLGGEMGLGLWYRDNSGYTTWERWTGTEYETETVKNAIDTNWGMDMFTTGNIFIMFHF
jgi:hypothetical protein